MILYLHPLHPVFNAIKGGGGGGLLRKVVILYLHPLHPVFNAIKGGGGGAEEGGNTSTSFT